MVTKQHGVGGGNNSVFFFSNASQNVSFVIRPSVAQTVNLLATITTSFCHQMNETEIPNNVFAIECTMYPDTGRMNALIHCC